jgi:hypothetical protein
MLFTLDHSLDVGRSMLEDVIKSGKISQIVLLIPSTALIYRNKKVLDPLFTFCNDVGCS